MKAKLECFSFPYSQITSFYIQACFLLVRYSTRERWNENDLVTLLAMGPKNLISYTLSYPVGKYKTIILSFIFHNLSTRCLIHLYAYVVYWTCRGDYDLIFDGIHENILQLQYHDPVMDKTVRLINYFQLPVLFCYVCLHGFKITLRVIPFIQRLAAWIVLELLICCIDTSCAPNKCLSTVKPLKLRQLLSPGSNSVFIVHLMM